MTDSDRIDCRPLQVFLLPSPWYRGRVVLIRGAAHATTPHLAMGAGIAIGDGIVLAEELTHSESLDSALDRFMARRFERCRIVVENSAELGAWSRIPRFPRPSMRASPTRASRRLRPRLSRGPATEAPPEDCLPGPCRRIRAELVVSQCGRDVLYARTTWLVHARLADVPRAGPASRSEGEISVR